MVLEIGESDQFGRAEEVKGVSDRDKSSDSIRQAPQAR